jgi:hypothetical protein
MHRLWIGLAFVWMVLSAYTTDYGGILGWFGVFLYAFSNDMRSQ